MIGNNNLMTLLPLLMSGMGNNNQPASIAEVLMKMQGGNTQNGMPSGNYGQGNMQGGNYGQNGMQGGMDNNNMMTMINLLNTMNTGKRNRPNTTESNTPPFFDTIGNMLPKNMIDILGIMLNNTKRGG